MKEVLIKKLIYNFWENKLEDVKPRIKNIDFLKDDLINNIVGPRRAGKTYFMFYISKILREKHDKKQLIYINCEHRTIYPLQLSDLNYLVEFIYQEDLLKDRVFLFLDEVQTVRGWEVFVKSIYDEFKGKIKILVSGSVKSLLSDEYGKFLVGRHKTIKIFPLSFKEYLNFKEFVFEKISEEKESKLKKFCENYINYGSFPKYVLTNDISFLEETFSDIIERDIKSRIEIRKKFVIDELSNLLLERVASRVSFTKLRNLLKDKGIKVTTDSIIKYASIFNDVFLFFFLPIYSSKYSQIIRNPQKVYIVDNGFLNIFSIRFSENLGKLMENAVFMELIKNNLESGKNIFYLSVNDSEIDFVIKEGLEIKQLIQVTYASSKDEIEQREIKAILKASELLKCKDLLIITWDYEDEIKINNKIIKFIPLWKWLLKLES